MIANILLTASQVGTLFLMMGVGFALAKWNKLTPEGVSQMSLLLLNVATPCIIMDALQVERTGALLQAMRLGAVLMLGIYLLWMVLSPLLFRRLEGAPVRHDLWQHGLYGPAADSGRAGN